MIARCAVCCNVLSCCSLNVLNQVMEEKVGADDMISAIRCPALPGCSPNVQLCPEAPQHQRCRLPAGTMLARSMLVRPQQARHLVS